MKKRLLIISLLPLLFMLIIGGWTYSYANDLMAWGEGTNGRLLTGTGSRTVPSDVLSIAQQNVIKVVGRNNNTIALKSDGTIIIAGSNGSGQLGTGVKSSQNPPIIHPVMTDVIDIALGTFNSYVLKSDGTVWAVGDNWYGQIGDGTTTERLSFVQVQNLTNVVALSAGSYFAVALKSDGTVWTWGRNNEGQLGNGTYSSSSVPVQVANITNAISISAFDGGVIALLSDGTVRAWGQGNYGTLGNNSTSHSNAPVTVIGLNNIISISAGGFTAAALRSDGTVWTWGQNYAGSLGNTTIADGAVRSTPIEVQNLSNVVKISTRGTHVLALRNDGYVFAWGGWSYGEIGDGTTSRRYTPVRVLGINNVADVFAGENVSFALVPQNIVSTLSISGPSGMHLGQDATYVVTTTTRPTGLSVKYILTCPDNTQKVEENSTGSATFTCSGSEMGGVGNKNIHVRAELSSDSNRFMEDVKATEVYTSSLTLPTGTERHISVAWGSPSAFRTFIDPGFTALPGHVTRGGTPDNKQVCFLKSGGTVWCTNNLESVPTQVSGLDNIVKVVGTGDRGYIALKTDGSIWVWGNNDTGALGLGHTNHVSVPTRNNYIHNIVDIGAGSSFAFAIKSDGTVYGWGNNSWGGPLCLGNENSTSVPVVIPSMQGAKSFWGGTQRSAFIRTESGVDKLYECGRDIGTSPVYRSNMDGTVKVQIGHYHNVALKSDGTVWVWGANGNGQLGLGHTTSTNPPYQQIPNFTNVVDISIGNPSGGTTIALKSDGTVWGFGSGYWANSFGLGFSSGSSDNNKVTPTLLPTWYSYGIFTTGTQTMIFYDYPQPSDVVNISITGPTTAQQYDVGTYTITSSSSPVPHLLLKYIITCPDNSTQNVFSNTGSASFQCALTTTGSLTIQARAELAIDATKFKTTSMVTTVSTETTIPPGSMLEEFSIMSSGSSRVNPYNGNTFSSIAGSPSFIASNMGVANQEGSCFLRGDKTVWCSNGYNTPTRLPGIRNVKKILGLGVEGFLALREDGTVWGWGGNSNGRLGLGDANRRTYPTMITGLSSITDIGAGSSFAFAIKSDGTVYGWGDNSWGGPLCRGNENSTSMPVVITSMQGAKSIWGGTQRSAFIRTESGVDKLYECGRDIGTSPVYRSNMDGTVKVQIGHYHNVALKSDGTVWVWGANGNGQLGLGHTTSTNPPYQQIPSFTDVVDISVGSGSGMHTLALKSDKTVFGWGWGIFTPFGLGPDNGNKTSPTQLPITGVKIFAGGQTASFVFTELPDVQSINITGPEEVEKGQNATYTITAVTKPTNNLSVKYTLTCPDNSTQTATNSTGSATLTCSAASMGNTGNKTISAKAELESDSSKFKTTTMSTLVYCPAPTAGEITGPISTFTQKTETYNISATSSCGTVSYQWSGQHATIISGGTASPTIRFTESGEKTINVRIFTSESPSRYVDRSYIVNVEQSIITLDASCQTEDGVFEATPFTCEASGSSNWGTVKYMWSIGTNNYHNTPVNITINSAGNYTVVARAYLEESASVFTTVNIPVTVENIPLTVTDIICDDTLYQGKTARCNVTATTAPNFTPRVTQLSGAITSQRVDDTTFNVTFFNNGTVRVTATVNLVERPAKIATFSKDFTVNVTDIDVTLDCPDSIRINTNYQCTANATSEWGTIKYLWALSRANGTPNENVVTFRTGLPGKVTVSVIASLQESSQISKTASKEISVQSITPPILSISGNPSVIRKSVETYTANASHPDGNVIVKFYFQGQEYTENPLTLEFNDVGVYQLTAQAYVEGFEDIPESVTTKSASIIVKPMFKPAISVKQSTQVLLKGENVKFTAIDALPNRTEVPLKLRWTLPGGQVIEDEREIEYTASIGGNNTITLTAWYEGFDSPSEVTTINRSLLVREYEFPDFYLRTLTRNTGVAPYFVVAMAQPLTKSGASVSNLFKYSWYVNNENIVSDSKSRVLTHTFVEPGSYELKVEITDVLGSKKDYSTTITVTEPPPMEIVFKKFSNKKYDTVPVSIVLRASTIGGHPSDRVVGYDWFINNVPQEKIRSSLFTYNFTEPGEYEIKVVVKTRAGMTKEGVYPISVYLNQSPNADFDFSVNTRDLSVKLTPKCTDPDGRVVMYEWDLGNGSISKLSTPVVRYKDPGIYTIKLKCVDDAGNSSIAEKEVNVSR